MKTRILVLFLLVACLLPLGSGAAVADDPVSGSTIVVAIEQEPGTLYIYGTTSWYTSTVAEAFLDGPIDDRSFDNQPVILEKLPSLDDGDAITQTVTVDIGEHYVDEYGDVATATVPIIATQMVVSFTLKPDILWSDGQPLTAYDSAFAFDVDCHPDTPTSKYTCDRSASYEAFSDESAVWTGLPGFWDAVFRTNFWTPLPEHVLGTMTPLEILESDYGRQPLGWGAFVVDEWVAGEYISLVRNPNYWRPGLPLVDRLEFRFISDEHRALMALLRGDVHVIPRADTSDLAAYLVLDEAKVIDVHAASGTVWEHIDFGILSADGRTPYFADATVRQAVAYGTNRQGILDVVNEGLGEVLNTYIPQEHPFYPSPGVLTEYDYDPVQARALLESVGWRDDDGDGVREAHGVSYKVPTWDWVGNTYGPTKTLTFVDGVPFAATFKTTDADHRQLIGAQFQQDMADIGIAMTPEYIPSGEYFNDGPDGPVFGRKFDTCEFAWLTGDDPPCNLYMANSIPADETGWAGQNDPGFVNPEYDDACNAAMSTLNRSARMGYHQEAMRILSEKLPVLPLYARLKMSLTNPNLLGLEMDATSNSELWNVEEWEISAHGEASPSGGGGVESIDGRTVVDVPAGAVDGDVDLIFTPWVVESTGNMVGIGHSFDLSAVYSDTGLPADLQPGATFDLTIYYDEAGFASVMREDELTLYAWDGSEWVAEPTSAVDTVANVITATPDHFSVWAVFGKTYFARLPVIVRSYDPALVFFDDFSDPGSGWSDHDPSDFWASYEGGEYQLYAAQSGWTFGSQAPFGPMSGNYSIETDVRLVSGSDAEYGIAFDNDDSWWAYWFNVQPSTRTYELKTIVDDTHSTLLASGSSNYINADDAVNHLKVERLDSKINISVNGHVLASVADSTHQGGYMWLQIESNSGLPAIALFDNFKVRLLSGGTSDGIPPQKHQPVWHGPLSVP